MQRGPQRAGSRCQCNSGHLRPCAQGPGPGLRSALAASSPMSWQLSASTIYTPQGYVLFKVSSYGTVGPRKIFKQSYRTGAPESGHDLYMPNASADSAECARQLPNL